MYQHHIDSIEKLKEYFADKEDVIAVILGGSVAKGCERPDSDIDAMVVITDEAYAHRQAEGRTFECIEGYCTYPEGYFDIKYYTKSFLRDAAEKGSEPARNAFLASRCLTSKDPEIPGLVERIPVFQTAEKEDKILSFLAAFEINNGYFWNVAGDDIFLKTKAATELVLFGLRIILEENEVLFPCPKGLFAAIGRCKRVPDGILDKARRLLTTMEEEAKQDFVRTVLDSMEFVPPADGNKVYSQYNTDNELWWRVHRPLVAEW